MRVLISKGLEISDVVILFVLRDFLTAYLGSLRYVFIFVFGFHFIARHSELFH